MIGGFLLLHYLDPLTATWSGDPMTSGPDLRTSWLITQGLSDADGHEVHNLPSILEACGSGHA